MTDTHKGSMVVKTVVSVSVLLLAALAFGSFVDLGPLNVTQTDDGCWHGIEVDNRTFDSEQQFRDYASDRGKTIPGNITFKTINGTLFQEAECIGGTQ